MVHRTQDPFRLLLPGESEMAMDHPDDDIDSAQVFISEIQAAVFQNVDFDPLQ